MRDAHTKHSDVWRSVAGAEPREYPVLVVYFNRGDAPVRRHRGIAGRQRALGEGSVELGQLLPQPPFRGVQSTES